MVRDSPSKQRERASLVRVRLDKAAELLAQ